MSIQKILKWSKNVKNKVKPRFWKIYYIIRNLLFKLRFRYGHVIAFILVVALLLSSLFFCFAPNNLLKIYFMSSEHVGWLRTLLVTLCAAMLGVSVITFSFVIFAMQTNMNCMPYGLFRKLNSDKKLLIYFIVIFFSSVVIGCMSVLPTKYLATIGMLSVFWCLIFILLFLLASYKRALKLINPVEQLVILNKDTEKNLKTWGKSATRLAPLLAKIEIQDKEDKPQNNILDVGYDIQRAAYFQLNPQWILLSVQAVQYAFSLARYHVEQGDYEISKLALNTIVRITANYIDIKGKTFLYQSPLLNITNSLTHDSFIQKTLELLRENLQISITSCDEQRITQLLETFKNLCLLYLDIDYSTKFPDKKHATLAAGYLANAIESVIPRTMVDVVMNGLRMLGEISLQFINKNSVESITIISEKIRIFSCISTIDKKYFPVTQVGVQQLAKLTYNLLISQVEIVNFALKHVNEDIKFISKILLQSPNQQIIPFNCSSLEYYYPHTNNDSLIYWLRDLGNYILGAAEDDEQVKRIVRHIAHWSDDLYQKEKELLLLAIEKKSSFINDVFYWIVYLTELLLAISKAPCCSYHFAAELKKNARWLICTLSWIPDVEEKLRFAENYNVTDLLFKAATDAIKHDHVDVANEISDLLLTWTFKAGKYKTCERVLEKGCYGLACLNVKFKMNNSVLYNSITKQLGKDCAPNSELLKKASLAIKNKAGEFFRERYTFSDIERAMSKIDVNILQEILFGVANTLCSSREER